MKEPEYLIRVGSRIYGYMDKTNLARDIKINVTSGQDYTLYKKAKTLFLAYDVCKLKDLLEGE